MIKNDRQYRVTKSQLNNFEQALRELSNTKPSVGIDPLLSEVQRRALESQRDELELALQEYESLLEGHVTSFSVDTFAELPGALIKARIALKLTQKDLAERLGLKEQQIQRWEANDYSGASINSLRDVMQALGVEVREEVFIPSERLSSKNFFGNLLQAGISRDLLLKRILPPQIATPFVGGAAVEPTLRDILSAAGVVSRVFSTGVAQWVTPGASTIYAVPVPQFKLPERSSVSKVTAYTVYAHYLSTVVESCSPVKRGGTLPQNPTELHGLLTSPGKPMTFREVLNFLWDSGLMVLPLRDSIAFHGAVWSIRDRFVLLLKQNTPLGSRWLYDALHETGHVAKGHVKDGGALLEEEPISPNNDSQEEEEANEWAEDALFGGKSEEIERACAGACGGSLERLKQVLPGVAERFNVNAGALANFMAYRLESEDKDWWGAAQNLQSSEPNPFVTARDILLSRVELRKLNPFDRELLMRAIEEE